MVQLRLYNTKFLTSENVNKLEYKAILIKLFFFETKNIYVSYVKLGHFKQLLFSLCNKHASLTS